MRKCMLLLLFLGAMTLQAQPSFITVEQANDTLLTITIDPQAHNDYGFSVPLTYALTLGTAQDVPTAWFRSSVGQLYIYHLAQSAYAMPTVVAERRESAPEQFQLLHNYPNPFNPATTIRYELKQTAPVRLRVFNALGQSVAALIDQTQSAGIYQIQWRAENLPGGVYLAVLETPAGRQSQKMLLVR